MNDDENVSGDDNFVRVHIDGCGEAIVRDNEKDPDYLREEAIKALEDGLQVARDHERRRDDTSDRGVN